MPARSHHGELKSATQHLVRATGGNAAAAKIIHRSASQVQRYTDPSVADMIRINEVLALETSCHDMIVTGMLAHLQSAALLGLTHRKNNGIHSRYARASAAFVTLSLAMAEAARRDTDISKADIPELTRPAHDVLSRVSDLLAAIHARAA